MYLGHAQRSIVMRRKLLVIATLATATCNAQIPPTWINSVQQAPNKRHYLSDMEVNSTGDIWLYGTASDTVGWPVGSVTKFSQFGLVQDWTVEFLDVGQLTDLDIDPMGNAYVGTSTYDTIGDSRTNYLTQKIGPDGTILWSAIYTGNGPNNLDRASALCLDSEGGVIITGFGEQTDYYPDWVTLKYGPDGNLLWVANHAPPTDIGGAIGGIDVTTDAANNIYVTGESNDEIDGNFATIKYAPDGTESWVKRVGGHTYSRGRVVRVVDDRVYVGGHYTYNALDSSDVVVAVYDTAGSEQWITRFNATPYWVTTTTNGRETLEDLQVDNDGNVYFTGTQFATNGQRDDYMIVKLDPEGTVLWHRHYAGGGSWDDPRSMFVDSVGSVYVTGRSESAFEGVSPVHTIKYDTDGNLLWYAPFSTAYYDYMFPGEIRWDGGANFYVGTSKSGMTDGRLYLLHYGITTGVNELLTDAPIPLMPNPMTTSMVLDLGQWIGALSISIMDVAGRTMHTERAQGGGMHTMFRRNLTAGVYSLHVVGINYTSWQRFVVE